MIHVEEFPESLLVINRGRVRSVGRLLLLHKRIVLAMNLTIVRLLMLLLVVMVKIILRLMLLLLLLLLLLMMMMIMMMIIIACHRLLRIKYRCCKNVCSPRNTAALLASQQYTMDMLVHGHIAMMMAGRVVLPYCGDTAAIALVPAIVGLPWHVTNLAEAAVPVVARVTRVWD